jgi:hypothetical protein
MAKVVTMRERVHQPFYDSLIRTAGLTAGTVGDNTDLFINSAGRTQASTNLVNGSTLPSDQSHVTLALRCFVWYRNPMLRIAGAGVGEIAANGDYGLLAPWLVAGAAVGTSAPATVQDYYRLIWQTEEQLHWSFGTGLKNSIDNMPTWYFPAGGGISGDNGGTTDLIHWQNSGTDGHTGILRLARAILLPPRQNIVCKGTIFALEPLGQAAVFGTTQGARNMLSLRDNLNAIDAMPKVIQFCFDGLFSRDVQ